MERKKRAMTSEKAKQVRQQGHDDAKEFAYLIGLSNDYQNDVQAKKDVIDFNGDSHSVKSGKKRWQIFLYGENRFRTDSSFKTMNGIGQILLEIINVFPQNFDDYVSNKFEYKKQLSKKMMNLKNKFLEKGKEYRIDAFLNKAFFNSGEVNYLTIKHLDKFHIFLNKDVLKVLSENFEITNSISREIPAQKVLFKYNGKNVGELEIRNSGKNHYKEILFVVNKSKMVDLLFGKIERFQEFNDKVIVYGNATRKFIKR